MNKDLNFTTEAGNAIAITLYGADKFGKQPCIIYVHGFKGYKDWGYIPYLGEKMAKAGFSFLAFNFSHNGVKTGGKEITELDKFEKNTISLEVSEILEIIYLCKSTVFFGERLRHPLGLLGHSRGGGVAILAAEKSPDVQALATWSGISTVEQYTEEMEASWKKQGYLEVINKRNGQTLRVGRKLLEDIERNARTHLNILAAVQKLRKPYLILHAEQDETVPVFQAEQLNIFADPFYSAFRLVPGATHNFSISFPFEKSNPMLEQAINITSEHFQNHLF